MTENEKNSALRPGEEAGTFRFPVEKLSLDVFRCPCGRDGIRRYKEYYTGLDDADPDWGGYDESFGVIPRDPCFKKYEILGLDEKNREWILKSRA